MQHSVLRATVLTALLLLLVGGCASQPAPPAADEAARQSEITRQGIANTPAGAPGAPSR